MATTSDIRNGLCIRYNNDIYKIVEFLHVKPGKGWAPGEMHKFFERNDARQFHLPAWRMNGAVIFGNDIDPV